ncbi:hypothetical protein Scep_007783 [Stephania cephalantha]|uniref:G domain-containing protein n=1 Tax=Stephania cephalantha TaxID=152367 RepID=A0AAP0KAJ2_9MAGN
MLARKLSTSNNLLKHLYSLSLSSSTHLHRRFTRHLHHPKPPPSLQNLISTPTHHHLTRDGNFDESTSHNLPICPGCGVHMQDQHPNLPGHFINPSLKHPLYKAPIYRQPVADEPEISNSLKRGFLGELIEPEIETLTAQKAKPVVCSRCHSLRHYGRVKDANVENLLPDFDFDHTIGRKLGSARGTRSVVLMVVDGADFEGSFPRKVARLVSETIDENSSAWKEGKSGNVPRVVLVVTKIDLLPSSLSPTRLEHWVRQRAREGGASRITSVHLVSAVRDWGLKNLIDEVRELVGARGNVWAIGAQNAGKSTLINAIAKHTSGKVTQLTEAPVPGTTLGIVRVEGILPGNAKLFDTPGLLHPHQITTRLTKDEHKLVHISKELKPRTYRIKVILSFWCKFNSFVEYLELSMIGHKVCLRLTVKNALFSALPMAMPALFAMIRQGIDYMFACEYKYLLALIYPCGQEKNINIVGHTVHIAGLLRLDVEEATVDTIYVTVWASPYLPLHMGKTENACKMVEDHFGHQLQPPIGEGRAKDLGRWARKEFRVCGSSWDKSSVDIAGSGIGWFAVGLKGEAVLGVWTYDGVDVTVRNSLIPDRAQFFEVAGFTVSKIVAGADQVFSKQNQNKKQKKKNDNKEVVNDQKAAPDADTLLPC